MTEDALTLEQIKVLEYFQAAYLRRKAAGFDETLGVHFTQVYKHVYQPEQSQDLERTRAIAKVDVADLVERKLLFPSPIDNYYWLLPYPLSGIYSVVEGG